MTGRLFVLQQGKTGSVGRPVQHGGVAVTLRELRPGEVGRLFTTAGELVFPTDNPGLGKPSAEERENFGGGLEDKMEAREVAGDFGRIEEGAVGPLHRRDGVVGQGGGVENGADVGGAGFGEILEGHGEILVGGELVEDRAGWHVGVRGAVCTEENGLEAGGCVRDELLGLQPHDYDIATSAKPAEVQKLFPHTQAVGAHFGVILVMEHAHAFEVATFRSDHEYLDGRRPELVTFSTPEEDATRRDFTINGMFHDPVAEKFIDFVGGQADLQSRTLRAIGDPVARFREDKLRLLRAIRFAARFDYDIEPRTWDAIRAHAADLHAVSAERMREELVKILAHPSRLGGFDLLDESGLLKEVLPEIEALKGCE